MKNIHVLPTEKTSRLRIGNNGNFVFGIMQNSIASKNDSYTNQHIYITSDEEIKEECWVLNSRNNAVVHGFPNNDEWKKIILSSNIELQKDGVQAIDDEFLEWFVKNPSYERVEVERDEREVGNHLGGIVIEYGNYLIIIPEEEPKQETLEEAAERLAPVSTKIFLEGAKWQQERSYTLEQISKEFVGEGTDGGYFDDYLDFRIETNNKITFKEWFEQFKKK